MALVGGMQSENHPKDYKGGKMFEFLCIFVMVALLFFVFRINKNIRSYLEHLADTEEDGSLKEDLRDRYIEKQKSYLEGKEKRDRERDPFSLF